MKAQVIWPPPFPVLKAPESQTMNPMDLESQALRWYTQHYEQRNSRKYVQPHVSSSVSRKRQLQDYRDGFDQDRLPDVQHRALHGLNSQRHQPSNSDQSPDAEVVSLLSEDAEGHEFRPAKKYKTAYGPAKAAYSLAQQEQGRHSSASRTSDSFAHVQETHPARLAVLSNHEPTSVGKRQPLSQNMPQHTHLSNLSNLDRPTQAASRKQAVELSQDLEEASNAVDAQSRPAPLQQPVVRAAPELHEEQADLVRLVMSGRNVFFTGSAGTGKSTVLKEFVRLLRDRGDEVNIVAPTGRAALDINGSTTWTYAGWTPDSMRKSISEIKRAAHGKFVHRRLNKTKVLVIDEISMVENLHFERLNALMKEARMDDRAFGGVQLIVTGDFCQLPPVKPFQYCYTCGKDLAPSQDGTKFRCPQHGKTNVPEPHNGEYYEIDKWAFRSKAWKECRFKHVQLQKIHRQNDEKFIRILQKCRISVELSETDKDMLLNHESNTENAVKLFSTREEVNRINMVQFCKLTTPKYLYSCIDFFSWNQEKHKHLQSKGNKMYDGSLMALKDHRYEPKLELKVGMLVVLLANIDLVGGLVNGSQGVIVGFKKHDAATDLPQPKKRDKSSKLDADASSQSEYATLKSLAIKDFIEKAAVKEWPIVQFANGIERAIIADCTINELGDEREYSLLSRTQIPLSAAWAMSIHKAQGMTLDKVVVDLSKSFEEGQMYVALSRARSLEGLKVEGLGTWQGRGNAQVKEFLKEYFGI